MEYDPPTNSTRGCLGKSLTLAEDLYSEQFICSGNFWFGVNEKGVVGVWVRGRKRKTIAPADWSQRAYSNFLHLQVYGSLILFDADFNDLMSWHSDSYKDAALYFDDSGVLGLYASDGTLKKEIEWM